MVLRIKLRTSCLHKEHFTSGATSPAWDCVFLLLLEPYIFYHIVNTPRCISVSAGSSGLLPSGLLPKYLIQGYPESPLTLFSTSLPCWIPYFLPLILSSLFTPFFGWTMSSNYCFKYYVGNHQDDSVSKVTFHQPDDPGSVSWDTHGRRGEPTPVN